ncbi:Protein of unknown function [Gryllus bimaculatus]|nr:Protein of unknown function [Gryllus bimaculatus]
MDWSVLDAVYEWILRRYPKKECQQQISKISKCLRSEINKAAFQTENGSSAVEHAATASAADAYSSLVKGKYLL